MSGWDFENKSENTGVKAEFTKFPVGITRIRIIDDAPVLRWTHWINQHKRSINCPGKGCPICEVRRQQKANKEPYTYNVAKRLAINIINRETGKLEIMEQGISFFEDLRDIREDLSKEGLRLQDVDIRVRRRGTGKDDTSYRLDIDERTPMSEADKKLAENAIDLQEYFKPHTPEQILRIMNGEDWNEVMYDSKKDDEKEQIELK